jgi:replicative DNA helicase
MSEENPFEQVRTSGHSVDRLPPHSSEAEQGVLGCVLLDPHMAMEPLMERNWSRPHFYDLRHQEIWAALEAMHSARKPIDIITLQQHMKDAGLLEQIGGIPYLSQLQDAVPSAANLDYYAEIVREKWLLRGWIQLCTEVVGKIYNYEGKVDQLTDKVSQDLHRMCERNSGVSESEKHIAELVADVHDEYIAKYRRGYKRRVGPQTGFNYLDNIVPGLGPTHLTFIAARPSMGKSALMLQIAINMAAAGESQGIFSLEMTSQALVARAIFERGGSDMVAFLNGFMKQEDTQKLANAGAGLGVLPIVIDDTPQLTIEQLAIKARRLARKHKIKVFWLDYFQLLTSRARRFSSRNEEMAYCSQQLKALARELKIPFCVLTQMNREIEKDGHRRPKLSDLRDTGQIEQDADGVWFLWRPKVDTEAWKKRIADILPRIPVPSDWKLEKTWKKNLSIVMLTVEKQREGPSHEDATMVFVKPWTRFLDAYRPSGAETEIPNTPAPPVETPDEDSPFES